LGRAAYARTKWEKFAKWAKDEFDWQEDQLLYALAQSKPDGEKLSRQQVEHAQLAMLFFDEHAAKSSLPLFEEVFIEAGGQALRQIAKRVKDKRNKKSGVPFLEVKEDALLDAKFDISGEDATSFAQEHGYKFAQSISEGTAKDVRKIFVEMNSTGLTGDEVRTRLRETFKGYQDYRVDRIARTETIRSSNAASVRSYQKSGIKNIQWITSSAACPYCAPFDGKIISIGSSFLLDGTVFMPEGAPEGTQPMPVKYGNIDFPPLHPNCECTVGVDEQEIDYLIDLLDAEEAVPEQFVKNPLPPVVELPQVSTSPPGSPYPTSALVDGDAFKEAKDAIKKILSGDEVEALNRYTGEHLFGSAYTSMNDVLRGKTGKIYKPPGMPTVEAIQEVNQSLIDAFDRGATVGKNTRVFRGTYLQMEDEGIEDLLESLRSKKIVGTEFIDKGFLSTSFDESIAADFGSYGTGTVFKNGKSTINLLFDIDLDADTRILLGNVAERELILPPGTRLMIHGVEETADKEFRVLAKVVKTPVPKVVAPPAPVTPQVFELIPEEFSFDDSLVAMTERLSYDQSAALNKYLSPKGAADINAWKRQEYAAKFWSGAKTAEVDKLVKDLESAFDTVKPLNSPVKVFRGVVRSTETPVSKKFLASLKDRSAVGLQFQDDGFISTSMSESTAKKFAGVYKKAPDSYSVTYEMDLSPSQKVLYGDITHEEIILKPGTKFVIRQVVEISPSEFKVVTEIVEDVDKSKLIPIAKPEALPKVKKPKKAPGAPTPTPALDSIQKGVGGRGIKPNSQYFNLEDSGDFLSSHQKLEAEMLKRPGVSQYELEKAQNLKYNEYWNSMNLSSTQRTALNSYTASGYTPMNSELRFGTARTSKVKNLLSVFDNKTGASMPENTATFRGTNLSIKHNPGLLEALRSGNAVGTEFIDKGFISTSFNENTAQSFAGWGGVGAEDKFKVLFRVEIPKGTHVAFGHVNEKEVVLDAGTKFFIKEVLDVSTDPNRPKFKILVSIRPSGRT